MHFDLLIVTRVGAESSACLIGDLEADVATGRTDHHDAASTNALNAVPLDWRGVSPTPLLGWQPAAAASAWTDVLAAFGAAERRESPRYPTTACTESIIAGNNGIAWNAVLTPGLLNGRSVPGDVRLGNPGHPAGPEDHAPGI